MIENDTPTPIAIPVSGAPLVDLAAPACARCRWFVRACHITFAEDRVGAVRQCRRYPPEKAGWPDVDENEWCGEFMEPPP